MSYNGPPEHQQAWEKHADCKIVQLVSHWSESERLTLLDVANRCQVGNRSSKAEDVPYLRVISQIALSYSEKERLAWIEPLRLCVLRQLIKFLKQQPPPVLRDRDGFCGSC